jgi:CubicO group peptidase (beta-lactamase class C family)
MAREFLLPESSPAALNFAEKPLADLDRLIRRHVEEGRYPGAQIALARHGQIALFRTTARRGPAQRQATTRCG